MLLKFTFLPIYNIYAKEMVILNINNQGFLNSIMSNVLSKNTENLYDKMLDDNIDKMTNTVKTQNLPNIDEQIKLLLTNLNEAPSKENTELLKLLMQNNFAITKENIDTLIKGNKFFENFASEKSIFMIQNKLKPTLDNFLILEKFISNENSMNDNIKNILNELIKSDNNFNLQNIFKNTSFESALKENSNILNEIKNEITQSLFKLNENNLELNTKNDNSILHSKDLKNILQTLSKNLNLKPDNIKTILDTVLNEILDENTIINYNKNEFLKAIFNKEDNLLNKLNVKNEFTKLTSNDIFNLNENSQNFKETLLLLKKEIILTLKDNPKYNEKLTDVFEKNSLNLKKLQFFDFENSSSEQLETFFEDLKSVSQNLKQNLQNFNNNINSNLNKNVENLGKTIDFMSNLNNTTFLQIPININNFETNIDLYIFNNKKNSKNKDKNSSGSALLSLNLANLGKIEVYITKIKNDVSCQFRLNEDIFKPLIKSNISLLENVLKEKNLQLKEVIFKSLDENYNLISDNISSIKNNNSIQISNFNAKA